MSFKRKLFYALPPSMRFIARRLYYGPADLWQSITQPNTLVPPKGLIYTGAGNFLKHGQRVINNLVNKYGLHANHKVLDIGSGIGRLAIPLTKVLNTQGAYCGFDVIQIGVTWCQKNISKKFSNFNFLYVPLHNDLYTSSGNPADAFQFPYPANQFDFALANSLFTHMMPNEVQNYFIELHKVLKPGAKVYATFFIVPSNEPNRYILNPSFSFPASFGNYALMDAKVTSANIAFNQDYLLSQIINPTQFKVAHQEFGYWFDESRATTCEEFQDILVLEKI